MLPGHATFRNLSRYSSYHERTFSRWYARGFDFVSLNKAAITRVIPAVTLTKLEARWQNGDAASVFSMATLKRRAFNQHLIERISQHLAQEHSLEKSSPDYEALCNYGTMSNLTA